MASLADCLLDTGPLVALISKRDAARERCSAVLATIAGNLLLTEAVLTEAMYLLGRQPGADLACLDFVLRPRIAIYPTNADRLARSRGLMAKYRDTPMDFADSTLVCLAEDLQIGRVFTLDRRGFTVFRWKETRQFELLP